MFYAIIGFWCLIVLNLQKAMKITLPQNDEQFKAIENLLDLLHSIWMKYMPPLIAIGIVMILFSFIFDALKKHRIVIQIIILTFCCIWAIAYGIASLPYFEAFIGIVPIKGFFTFFMYFVAILGFGSVFLFMILPNYMVLKRIRANKTDI